jgi:hypothetical protein
VLPSVARGLAGIPLERELRHQIISNTL